jgi:hypothetical protein
MLQSPRAPLPTGSLLVEAAGVQPERSRKALGDAQTQRRRVWVFLVVALLGAEFVPLALELGWAAALPLGARLALRRPLWDWRELREQQYV